MPSTLDARIEGQERTTPNVDITAHDESNTAGRRRLLRAVGLGGALATLPVIARAASAGSVRRSSAETDAETETPATVVGGTTDADVELLDFAQSVELAAAQLYSDAAAALGGEPVTTAQIVDVFGAHHRAYAQAISGLLGRRATNVANPAVLEAVSGDFQSAASVLEAAIALEDAAVATHLELVGQLVGTDGAALISSIITVEARHSAALRAIAGESPMPTTPAADTGSALTPDDFPVEG